ncbi:hypothetical protein Nepgr_033628 [Nepenthes gracilis]|uniref:Uncharacterized protein n=1 Tax=Nepenthes gracilis TaxID=150966 RepID=A0AAD3Y8S8_NEPGR|nr:hypothetical protein Nepgr_033628 [Nepenthes gracilis]
MQMDMAALALGYHNTNTERNTSQNIIAKLDRGQKPFYNFAAASHGQRPSRQQKDHDANSIHPQNCSYMDEERAGNQLKISSQFPHRSIITSASKG